MPVALNARHAAPPRGLSPHAREARRDFEVAAGAVRVDVVGTRFYTFALPARTDAVALLREPTNQYDPLAVKVVNATRGQQLGHLPRPVAAALAPLIDTGCVHATAAFTEASPARLSLHVHVSTLQRHVEDGRLGALEKCPGFAAAPPLAA